MDKGVWTSLPVSKLWNQLDLSRLLQKFMDDSQVASHYDEVIFAMVLNRLMDPNISIVRSKSGFKRCIPMAFLISRFTTMIVR